MVVRGSGCWSANGDLDGGRCCVVFFFLFFQAEDGIRYLVRSRGLGDVYKRQAPASAPAAGPAPRSAPRRWRGVPAALRAGRCLLYTSDAADERSRVDLGGRRITQQKNTCAH